MEKEDIIEAVDFFSKLQVNIEDISSQKERNNNQKKVIATYNYLDKSFKTEPLFYKEISGLDNVKHIDKLHQYFGDKVFWLDIENHPWPKPSGESDLDSLVIDDIIQGDDIEFKNFLLKLANNDQTGFIQKLTSDGRPAQYYHNLENNNHWHDLVLMIKAVIKSEGEKIDKGYFKPLIYKWFNSKRATLFRDQYSSYKMLKDLYSNIQKIASEMKLENLQDLLNYKKQIILQGPPGTGKTRLAKQIAKGLTPPKLTKEAIQDKLQEGDKIPNASGVQDYYLVRNIGGNSLSLVSENTTKDWQPTYEKIIEKYDQLVKGDKPENKKSLNPYELAVAKYFFQLESFTDPKLSKIIQFHPSYTYEDFVRGIETKPKGDSIQYKSVNKTLGEFASKALENYRDSQKDKSTYNKKELIKQYFGEFRISIQEKLIESDKSIALTENVGIEAVEDDAFRVSGMDSGNTRLLLKFKDIIQGFTDENQIRQDVRNNKNLSGTAMRFASYTYRIINLFQGFLEDNNYSLKNKTDSKPELKNYVLIIDEINRANLSAVLGELIYALEYRGEPVESMYAVEDDKELILPSNLYIIGTMNTADRSVGHIDYAIRRRFSFVDVLPQDLSGDENINFDYNLFKEVEKLFDDYLSGEFEKNDVQLGHSYFIDRSKDGGSMTIRLEYEIKPILMEYIKDGILKEEALENIKSLSVEQD